MSIPSRFKMKFWGWGNPIIRFHIDDYPGINQYFEQKLGVSVQEKNNDFSIEKIYLSESSLPDEVYSKFAELVGEKNISRSKENRIIHASGKSYRDLLQIRSGKIESSPDFILFPESINHISKIFKLAEENNIALIPFGGGTSVVGGVETKRGDKKYCATLNLCRLNNILDIDEISQTVTVQSGIFGSELEEKLNENGYTMGHFPQSFEFSTLGGWIASRSSGQNSVLYGGIEKILVSATMISPTGEIKTLRCPRRADGSDLKELILGSEGTLGVVTDATIKIRPLPAEKKYFMLAFRSFEEGINASRLILQSDIGIAMCRVSDEEETQALLVMGKTKNSSFFSKNLNKLLKRYFSMRGFLFPKVCLVLIGLEGSKVDNSKKKKKIKYVLSKIPNIYLGVSPGKKWLKDRFFLPYLRDELMDNNIMTDTLETATTWRNLEYLYVEVKNSILKTCSAMDTPALVYTHVSHLYRDGASLYFSIIAPQKKGEELSQWLSIKQSANETIKKSGGVISHHHGIGIDHKYHTSWNKCERNLLTELKKSLDPQKIMNPEKLL